MTYKKVNMVTELRKLAKGKPTETPVSWIAEWAIERIQESGDCADVEELKRLFYLPDTRPH